MQFAIGIPVFNEEKNIGGIILKLKKKFQKIIICDDGSIDLTSEIAEKLGALVVKHEKNMGYGEAIKTIFHTAKQMEVDVLITFDGDGQHKIEDIDKVLSPILKNDADCVIGSRFLEKTENIPKYRKFGIKTITDLTNLATGSNISDSQSGFRAYNKKVIQEIKLSESGMGVSTEILIKIKKLNFRIVEVPINVSYEGDTSTHNPIAHGTSVILSTLKYVSIEHPLVFYGIPGLILFAVGLGFGIWATQIFLEQGQLITNITIIGVAGMVIGIMLLVTSIILFSLITIIKNKT